MSIMANSNSFLSPWEILLITQERKMYGYFGEISLFYHEMCCVYSLESFHQGNSNEYTQIIIINYIEDLGPVVQSIVSLMSKCKSYSHFFSKNISVYAIFDDQRFNDTLTTSLVLNNWALGYIL